MDLDRLRAERAAKREAEGKGPIEVIFGGITFTFPAEMPAEAAMLTAQVNENDVAAASEATLGAMKVLLGDQYDAFMALQPSLEDVEALFDGLGEEWGVTVGEPSASGS